MSLDFQAVGRDVQSEADSAGDSALASAVKSLVQWFAGDAFSDGLWHVKASASASGASLSFELVEAGAYVAPSTYEDVPASAEELARSAGLAEEPLPEVAVAPVEAPAAPETPAEPVAAVDATPDDTPAVETAPVDPPVAASSDASSEPQSTSSTPAPEPYEGT
jgi:hypothetical protein